MHIFRDIDNLPAIEKPVITIGTFDGVHLGHQKIIEQLKEEAGKIKGSSVIVTFYPHPRKIVHQEQQPLQLLNSLPEKLALLQSFGVDNVIVVPFDEAFAAQTAAEYVEDFLVKKIHPKIVIIGYDHRFGKGRLGNYHTLENDGKRLGFQVKEIPEELLNEVTVSSTRIRKALKEGDVYTANNFLGHVYSFEGQVVKGDQLGRTIGYPTANLQLSDTDKLLPANGVYAVRVSDEAGANYNGMLNIGTRPTVNGSRLTIEVNLFDFDRDIYGQVIRVSTISRLRDEQKFDSLEALKKQLKADKARALQILL